MRLLILVDVQAEGGINPSVIPGFVCHNVFYNIHEVSNKLNSYTTRLVINREIKPSRLRGVISAIGVFFKWYLFSGAWRKGRVGLVTDLYATFYRFLKYFRAWYWDGKLNSTAHRESASSARPQNQD